jgi:hypothetical protein
MLPTRAHMSALIRKWERMDVQRRKRVHMCVLTRAQVEDLLRARMREATLAAHARAHATVVAHKPRTHKNERVRQAPQPGHVGV